MLYKYLQNEENSTVYLVLQASMFICIYFFASHNHFLGRQGRLLLSPLENEDESSETTKQGLDWNLKPKLLTSNTAFFTLLLNTKSELLLTFPSQRAKSLVHYLRGSKQRRIKECNFFLKSFINPFKQWGKKSEYISVPNQTVPQSLSNQQKQQELRAPICARHCSKHFTYIYFINLIL